MALRDFFNIFNGNCCKHPVPQDYLSLDETLYPISNTIGFKQYNPSKPAKHGLLFKSWNDSRYSYTYNLLLYAGKPIELPSSRYIAGSENYVKELVKRLYQTVTL